MSNFERIPRRAFLERARCRGVRIAMDALARHSMQALKKLVGVAVAAELAALGGSYYAFHKLNTDPEFRGWVDTNCPAVLDGFCAAVEAVGHELPADLKRRREQQSPRATREDEARRLERER